ncbi:ROK family protein [Microtetraspora malaysiensis]|uniref:ROK family protein n=1 Tax=Microtetraspora malaysiensis TaxID=161358 RepID=UPI000830B559|nr:ROK family protein [Microtetraspora malaysiensis]
MPEALLADAIGLDVTLENGVRAPTVAEHWFGEGVGASPFVRTGRAVGLALASVVQPGRPWIVVAGEEAVVCDLLEHQVREALAARAYGGAYGGASRCRLVLRPLRPEGWERGAAVVALRGLFPDGRVDGRWNGRRPSFPFVRQLIRSWCFS